MKKPLTRLSFSIPSELYEAYKTLASIQRSSHSPKKLVTETLAKNLDAVREQIRLEVGEKHYEFGLAAHARWAEADRQESDRPAI